MKHAVIAGRSSFLAGRMMKKAYASASSPMENLTGGDYIKVHSAWCAFAALKADGSITTWGETKSGGKNALNAPTDKDYIKVYSTGMAFAALKADGSITAWGRAAKALIVE
jgi:hypothetical protein